VGQRLGIQFAFDVLFLKRLSEVADEVSYAPNQLASALVKEDSDLRNQRIGHSKLCEGESRNRELAHAKYPQSKL